MFDDGSFEKEKDNAKFEAQCGPTSCLHHKSMPVEEIAAEVSFDHEDSNSPCYKEEKGNETQCGPNFCLPQEEGTPIDVLQENGTISKQSMLKLCPGSSFPYFHPCDFKQPPPPYVELDFACEVASKRPQGAAYLGGVELSDHVLGQGSYGAVIVATHWNLKVAAKSMHPILQISPWSIQQFENECETLRNITHPNIVQFMGIYKPDDDTPPYLIMELMKGGSLNQLVDSLQEGLRVVSLQQKINIMLDIALALSYLHNERKITHRDLSSSNVLLTEDLKAKVSDLGMSRPFTTACNQPSTLAPGCLSYMPPESLVQGSQFSPPGDIFSFGVILIELIIEEHPRPRAVRVSEVERRKRDLCDFERKAPDSLRDLVIQCLKDNPEERPTSSDIASRLQNLMNSCDCASGEYSVKRYNSNPGISQPEQVSNQQEVAFPLFPSSAQGSFLHSEDVSFSTSETQQETMLFTAEVGTGNLLEPPLTSNSPYVYGNQIITSLPIPTQESEEESIAEESEQHSFSCIMQESQKDAGKLVAGVFGSNENEATAEEGEESDFKDSVEEEDEESDCKDSCTASESQDTSNSYAHSFLSALSEKTSELLTEYPQLFQGNFQCRATHLNSVVSFPLALNSRCSQIKQVSRFSECLNVHSWILDIMMKRSIANTTLCVSNFKMFMDLHVSKRAFKLVEQMSYVFQHVNSQPSSLLLDKNKTSTIIPMLKLPFSCEHPTSASLCSTVVAKNSTTHNFHSKTYFSAVFFQAALALYSNGLITSAFFCSTLVSRNSKVHTFQAKSIILAIFQAKIVLYGHSVCLLLKAVLFMTSTSRFGYILLQQVLWYLPCVVPLLDEQLSHKYVILAIDYGTKCSRNGHLHSLMFRLSEDHIASLHRVCLMAKLALFLFFSQIRLCTSTLSTSLKGSRSCADKINLGLSAVSVSEVSILQLNRSKTSSHDHPPLSHTPSPVGLNGFKELESLLLHCLHSYHKESGDQITDSHRIHIAERKLYWLIYSLPHHQATSRFSSPPQESRISLALQGPSRFDVSPLNLKLPNIDLKGHFPDCQPLILQATLALYSNGVITSASFCSTVVSKNLMVHTFQAKSIILTVFRAKIACHFTCLLLKAVLFISMEMTIASRISHILVEQVLWYLPCVIQLLDEQLSCESVTSAIDHGTKCSKNGHLHPLMYRSILTSEDHIASVNSVCFMDKQKLFLLIYSFSPCTPCLCTSTLSTSLKDSPSCADKINLGLSAVSVSEVSILQPNRSKTSCHDCPPLSHTPSPVGLNGFKELESLLLHYLHSHHKVICDQITDSQRIHIAKRKLYWLIYLFSHHQATSCFSSPSHDSTISHALQGPSRFDVSPLNLKLPNIDMKGLCTFDVSEVPLLSFKQPGKIQRSYLDFSILTHIQDCQPLILQATLALHSNGVITSASFCSTVVSKNSMVHTFQAKSIILAIFQAKIASHSTCLLFKAVLFISIEMTSASRIRYILVKEVLWYLLRVIPLLDEQLSHENITSAIDYGTKCSMNEHLSLMCRLILTSEDHIASVHRVCLMAKLKLFLFFSQGTPCLYTSTLSISLKGSPSCADKINLGLSAVSVSDVSILQPNQSKTSCHDCPPLSTIPSPVGLDGFKELESLLLHCLHSHHKVICDQIKDSHRIHIAKRKLYWLIYLFSHHQATSRFSSPSHDSTISHALQGPSPFDVSPLNLKQLNLDLIGPCTFDVSEASLLDFKQPSKIKRFVLTHIHSLDCQPLTPHYLHSHHIEGGDQITGMHRVHLIAMLKLYWLINSPLCHQSTSCFNKVPSRLALQGTGSSTSASVNWNWPRNSHYKAIGDPIKGLHTMYLIAELRLICSPSHTFLSAFSPSHKGMVNLALQESSPINASESLLHLNLSLPHMPMTEFLNSLITGNMVNMMLQMQLQWSDSSLTSSAPTHSHSPMFISLMWSLKLQSCDSTSGNQITSVCGVLIAKLTASWINTSPSCESTINLAVEALSHPSLKQSIYRALYSQQLHGTVLQSNKRNCNDKVLQIGCNDVSTMIHTRLFTCSKLLMELIGSKTLMVHCLYSTHNTSGEQIRCVHRVHLIDNLKLCRPSCSPSHCQSTSHFNACSSYMNKKNLALQEPSAPFESQPPLADLEQSICSALHLPHFHSTVLHANCDSEQCRGSSNDPISKRELLGDNATSHRKSGRGDKLWRRKLLKSRGNSDDKKNKVSKWHLTQKVASQCCPKHLKYNSLSGARRESRYRTEVFMITAQYTQINSGLHRVKVLMSALSSEAYLFSSRCPLVKLVHLSNKFLITEARTNGGFDLSTFSHFLLVGFEVMWSTIWHNRSEDQLTSQLISQHCGMHLFTNPFLLTSISAHHKTSSSFLFRLIKNVYSYTGKRLALQRPNTLPVLDTSFLDLTRQQFKVVSSPQSGTSSQNTDGCCGKEEDCSKEDKDSSGDEPQDSGSGQGPPGNGNGDKDDDNNDGEKKCELEDREGQPSEQNNIRSKGRQRNTLESNPWNVVKKGSVPTSGTSGRLWLCHTNPSMQTAVVGSVHVTPNLQCKIFSLLSGVYTMLLQHTSMTPKSVLTVYLRLKGCSALPDHNASAYMLVFCNGTLCIHLHKRGMHLCSILTLQLSKWKEKSLKPTHSITYETNSESSTFSCLSLDLIRWLQQRFNNYNNGGAGVYREQSKEKWLCTRKTGPQSDPENLLQNVAISSPVPLPLSEITVNVNRIKGGGGSVSTALAPESYDAPISKHETTLKYQNVPIKRQSEKRQKNVGCQENMQSQQLILNQHTPEKKNDDQESNFSHNAVEFTANPPSPSSKESNHLPNITLIDTLGVAAVKHFLCTEYANLKSEECEFSMPQQEHGSVHDISEIVPGCQLVISPKYTVIPLFPLLTTCYDTSSSTNDDTEYLDAESFDIESEAIENSGHSDSEVIKDETIEESNNLKPKCSEWEEAKECTKDVCSPYKGSGDESYDEKGTHSGSTLEESNNLKPKCSEWGEAKECTKDVCSPYKGSGDESYENKDENSAHSGSEVSKLEESNNLKPKYGHELEETEECPIEAHSLYKETGNEVCENKDNEGLEQAVECEDIGEMYPCITSHRKTEPAKKQLSCLLTESDVLRMREGVRESLGRGIRTFPPTISSCLVQDIGGSYMSPEQESPIKVSRHCTTLSRQTASSSGSLLNVHTSLQRRA